MRRETAVAIATLVIFAAFFVVYRYNRVTPEEVTRIVRRASVPIRSGPRSSLLSTTPKVSTPVKSVRVSPSPALPSVARLPVNSAIESPYPVDSVCDVIWSVSRAGTEKESDDRLLLVLDPGARDDDVSLFRALIDNDWPEVEGLDRYSNSPSAGEVALLARLGQFMKPGAPDPQNASVDPIDLYRLDDMASADPQNAFWPLLKYSILKDQGTGPDRLADYLAIAETAQTYRNPVSSFYSALRERSLESPETFTAFNLLFSKAPILDSSPVRSLQRDVGRSPDEDARIARIGKLIVDSQLRSANGGGETHGNMLDAVLGANLQARAEGRMPGGRAAYEKMRGVFYDSALDLDGWDQYLDPNACDEEGLRKLHAAMVEKKAASNSQSSPSPLPRD